MREARMDWKSRIRESVVESGTVLDEDVIEELADHVAAAYQRMRADGCDAVEAESHAAELIDSWRRQAPSLRRRSNQPIVVEPPSLESRCFAGLVNDVRYALRVLRRQYVFAILAISTMAVGIGIVTSMFSVVDAVVWKAFPWPEPDRIIRLTET